MIAELASPTVCVIDDEENDYRPILKCLNEMFVSAVHLNGELDSLPAEPFKRVRLAFVDLHLSGTVGKDAASYTANYFRNTISAESAPVLVVIWSKYAADKVVEPEGEETEAQLFKRTLLDAEPKFKGRLIFVAMNKPKAQDRPADWAAQLQAEVGNVLQDQPAVELLWGWDRLVRDGCAKISQDLTVVASTAITGADRELKEGLKATLQRLTAAESIGAPTAETAPRCLITVLTQLLVDQLEHPGNLSSIAPHGSWLSQTPPGKVPENFPAAINGLLLTANVQEGARPYIPGTVYRVTDPLKFQAAFGKETSDLLATWLKKVSSNFAAFQAATSPVLIEISPVCDVEQGKRVSALLVAGFVVSPSCTLFTRKNSDGFGYISAPFNLYLRQSDAIPTAVDLHYCNLFRTTLPAETVAGWLEPWFRLRDLPVASIRNSNAAHAARIGYVVL